MVCLTAQSSRICYLIVLHNNKSTGQSPQYNFLLSSAHRHTLIVACLLLCFALPLGTFLGDDIGDEFQARNLNFLTKLVSEI